MQPGNIVRLKKNFPLLLLKRGYDINTVMHLESLIGTDQVVQEIRQDHSGALPKTFVLLDACVEVPIECCQLQR